MLDIVAFPIAVALTLWDAVPVYLSVGLAITILINTLLPRKAQLAAWQRRERLGIEGLVYALLFQPAFAPAVLVAAGISLVLGQRTFETPTRSTSSQSQAITMRLGELLSALFFASVIASLMKLGDPHIPGPVAAIAVASVGGFAAGTRSGVTAIPALTAFWHLGGWLPGLACIAGAIVRDVVPVVRKAQAPFSSADDGMSRPSASAR